MPCSEDETLKMRALGRAAGALNHCVCVCVHACERSSAREYSAAAYLPLCVTLRAEVDIRLSSIAFHLFVTQALMIREADPGGSIVSLV